MVEGVKLFYKPEAIYDKKKGVFGFHPVSENGLQFNMGTDSGIRRIYEDTTVVNGRKYYYAVTAFDRGLEIAGISPSESPVQISLNPDGTVDFGQNVLKYELQESKLGILVLQIRKAAIYQGAPGGTVEVEVIDPMQLKLDNLYEVVFEDTL